MAIGKRIKFFRNRKGLTQKQLGEYLGFMGKTSDVRMAQYEAEARIPKDALVNNIAYRLDVSPDAIKVPNIDNDIGLAHTFFALEDMYGLKITKIDGEYCLHIEDLRRKESDHIYKIFRGWQEQAEKLESGEITQEEYDRWRYYYPKYDKSQIWGKVPSQEISDYMVRAFKDRLKED